MATIICCGKPKAYFVRTEEDISNILENSSNLYRISSTLSDTFFAVCCECTKNTRTISLFANEEKTGMPDIKAGPIDVIKVPLEIFDAGAFSKLFLSDQYIYYTTAARENDKFLYESFKYNMETKEWSTALEIGKKIIKVHNDDTIFAYTYENGEEGVRIDDERYLECIRKGKTFLVRKFTSHEIGVYSFNITDDAEYYSELTWNCSPYSNSEHYLSIKDTKGRVLDTMNIYSNVYDVLFWQNYLVVGSTYFDDGLNYYSVFDMNQGKINRAKYVFTSPHHGTKHINKKGAMIIHDVMKCVINTCPLGKPKYTLLITYTC